MVDILNQQETYKNLEESYRASACRSTTPFFSERKYHSVLAHPEDTVPITTYRTMYQHDRDKIIYSLYFRRLRLKCQMFPEHIGDHVRTRLDHSLEVAQISRHIAKNLKLNEDLVDAIALAHDIGHTPFAHSGERALHKFLKDISKKDNQHPNIKPDIIFDGFKHNWQGIRVVDKLAKCYPENEGLNLTKAVRIGILLHTRLKYKDDSTSCSCDMESEINKEFNPEDSSINFFEAQVVAIADEIAQVIHDFEDAIYSNLFDIKAIFDNLDDWKLINDCIIEIQSKAKRKASQELKDWENIKDKLDLTNANNKALLLARLRSEIIFQLSSDTIQYSKDNIIQWEKEILGDPPDANKFNDFVRTKREFPTIIDFNTSKESYKLFKKKINAIVINSEKVNRLDGKADYMIRHILEVYLSNPKQVHQEVLNRFIKEANLNETGESLRCYEMGDLINIIIKYNEHFVRSIIDYIAGMTDRFLIREYDQLYDSYPKLEI
jgi:dGTPase